jgi:uncharacterized protein with von Willebrand factor type A (vWA) domain
MLFEYSEWDGTQEFQPLAAEAVFDKFSEYLLEYGDYLLRRLDRMDADDAEVLKLLVKEGFLEEDEKGQFRVAAKGVRRMEEKALHELFLAPQKDTLGKHETDHKGAGQVVHEDSKPYEYGDSVANLNLHETLKNALIRQGGGIPLHISEDDFENEYQTSCATVLLLDMSGSMARYGKFYEAKKVALALQGLVRGRYPEDSLQTIGFYTYASPLTERDLVRSAPKPVSLFDSRVFLRIPLDQPNRGVPEHFTNIQAGLRFARHALHRQPARNKQIICVTDGEPTAHLEGRDLVLIYPPSERTARATLEEVHRCTSEGIRLSTFALIEDYFYLGLMNFVDQMARLSRGLAVYCTAGQLGHYVLDSFVHGHRSRRHVG